mmetsp:Transcript_6631/g.15773  ORF Transcript_6631/g.15773 Transcript_6631/m.15773 type:complete len:86 (+) Transcript_6631:47-304(+)
MAAEEGGAPTARLHGRIQKLNYAAKSPFGFITPREPLPDNKGVHFVTSQVVVVPEEVTPGNLAKGDNVTYMMTCDEAPPSRSACI